MRGNGFQGTANGRLGDTVFYRRKGEQCARIYVKPQTSYSLPSLKVRCRFASASLAWQVFKQAGVTAFQRTEKDSANNLFQKYNTNIAPYLTRSEYTDRNVKRQCKIAPYVISWGDLSNIWEPITTITPYVQSNGQQKAGLTLRFTIDHDPVNSAFEGREEEGTIQTSLGYIVTSIARYYGSIATHLGLFAAYGPAHDDNPEFGYVFDRFAYAELWNTCPQDISCTAQWMPSENKWSLTFGGTVNIMGWNLTATYDNPGITITFALSNASQQTQFTPCAVALIAVARDGGKVETSRSQIVMQDWMYNPYNASIEERYSDYAAGTFKPDQGQYIGDNQLICGPN